MANVSDKDIQNFTSAISQMAVRTGNGKVAIDSTRVRQLVKKNQDVAERYVELMCIMAASQPGYLQPAMLVAGACLIEFQNSAPLEQVASVAKKLGATDILAAIGIGSPR